MRIPWRFSQAVYAVAERAPVLRRLQGIIGDGLGRLRTYAGGLEQFADALRPVFGRGTLVGGLLFLVVGGILGAMNRGAAGAIVGGLSSAILGAACGASVSYAFATFPFLTSTKSGSGTLRIQMEREGAHYLPGDIITGQLLVSADRNTCGAGR